MVNEKIYTVLSLTKMTNFRGVYAGQYIVARIFKSDEEYYVVEIANVLSHSQKDEAMRFAVMHNLWFYNTLMERIRAALDAGEYDAFRAEYSEKLERKI